MSVSQLHHRSWRAQLLFWVKIYLFGNIHCLIAHKLMLNRPVAVYLFMYTFLWGVAQVCWRKNFALLLFSGVYYGSKLGQDSSVRIATGYGLDGPGIESRRGRDFLYPFRQALGAHPASYKMGTGSFSGVKRPGRGVDHPPPSSAEVKERVELYLYSPSRPSRPVLGWNLPLLFTFN
jgi:hypothetical protein